jgi:hypothetical protein
MIKIKPFFKINILAVLLVGLLTVGVYGQQPDHKPVAEEMFGGSGISWMPKINYSRLVLTISRPDGTVLSTSFDSGSAPYVGLASIMGDSYADGSYTYELRVIPQGMQKLRQESELETAGEEKRQENKALTQSGYFYIRGGAIVTPGESEGGERSGGNPGVSGNTGSTAPPSGSGDGLSTAQDICYVDDLIVDGSLCVGFDCTCNYSFGFDTIVLKENNLRIFFDDTSVSGSFPRNDWRIVINDTANGGASYFGVEDSTAGRRVFTLEAGAPSHSLYVDDGGRVGLGTSTPVVDMHILSGNTPTVRLDQDGSSGFAPQVWDVAGNETSFFIRDASNGSQLPLRIRPGADSNSLVIDTDGDIGIGVLSPGFPVHLKTDSSSNAAIVAERTGGATNFMNATATQGVFGTTTDHNVRLVRNSLFQMDLIGNSDIEMADGGGYNGTWNPASSRELKENIMDLTADEAMDALGGLNPVKYNYKADKEEPRVGFIAEDVPTLVAMNGRKTLGTVDIVAVLTKVLQQQQQTIAEQQKTLAELKEKVARLEKNSH